MDPVLWDGQYNLLEVLDPVLWDGQYNLLEILDLVLWDGQYNLLEVLDPVLWDGQGVPVQAGQVLTPGEGAERFLHHTLEPIQVAYREEFLKK